MGTKFASGQATRGPSLLTEAWLPSGQMPSEVRTNGGPQGCLRSRRPPSNSLPATRPSVPPSGPATEVPTIGAAITALSKTVAFASRDRRAHHPRTKRRYLTERKRTDPAAQPLSSSRRLQFELDLPANESDRQIGRSGPAAEFAHPTGVEIASESVVAPRLNSEAL